MLALLVCFSYSDEPLYELNCGWVRGSGEKKEHFSGHGGLRVSSDQCTRMEMCVDELGFSQDDTHMHTHSQRLCLHARTQTEVCFVLTGWWSGAPVCGLHPEGESQVLLGCRGARQSTVLPGAHIWGKGRQHWLYCYTVLFSQIWTGSTTIHVISVRCFYIFMFTHLCALRCK